MSVEFDVKCTNISIHALREEGDYNALVRRLDDLEISIHALREEGDCPVRVGDLRDIEISIHALREEGDGNTVDRSCTASNFYPRPPRGGRHLTLPR